MGGRDTEMEWLSFLWKRFNYHAYTSLKRRPKGYCSVYLPDQINEVCLHELQKTKAFNYCQSLCITLPIYLTQINFLKIFKTERDFLVHQALSLAVTTLLKIYTHTSSSCSHFPPDYSVLLDYYSLS